MNGPQGPAHAEFRWPLLLGDTRQDSLDHIRSREHSDNGPEFVSRRTLGWIAESGIEVAQIDPGKPWQNGTDESFNGRLRDECLSVEWFRNRVEARVVIEQWRRHYSTYTHFLPTEGRGFADALSSAPDGTSLQALLAAIAPARRKPQQPRPVPWWALPGSNRRPMD